MRPLTKSDTADQLKFLPFYPAAAARIPWAVTLLNQSKPIAKLDKGRAKHIPGMISFATLRAMAHMG
jgi:hypothetical protein